MLDSFIANHCARTAGALVPLATFRQAFLQTIPAADHVAWTRTRFIAELAARGYRVGSYQGRSAHVYGLALTPAATPA